MRPTVHILDEDLIRDILTDAKRILAEIGFEIRGPGMQERLLAHGFPQTSDGRILFPTDLVDRAIETTPKSFTLHDRDGRPHADLGGDRVHFVPGSSGLSVLDHRTGQTRLAGTADFVEYARVCDGLEHIAYLATAFSTNDDIEQGVADAWRLYLTLTNSRKPVVSGAFTEHGVPRMTEMMGLFRADREDLRRRPMSIFTITATGNFRYSEDSCQNLIDCVEAGIPIEVVPVTILGLIAPVSIVGATVFHVVDVLAGLTMAQVVRPGAPVLFGGAPAAFHMRNATSPMLAVESLRLDLAYVAVAKSLGLPSQSYMAFSDAKFTDAQAGAETFSSAILAALSGINSVSGPGMLDYLLVFSLEKLVFDNEVCGQALQFVRPVEQKGDLPADDLVRQLLSEGHLLTSPHTLERWEEEMYLPGMIFDRLNRDTWSKAGAWDLSRRARDEVERRLAMYEPLETDPLIVAELQKLIRSGLVKQERLPEIPEAIAPKKQTTAPGRVRKFTRKE
jgi:trimethylamine--corrinoid protein Co-methyltransferase